MWMKMSNESSNWRWLTVSASFYLTGPIRNKTNIYTAILQFNSIQSRFRARLGLELELEFIADVYYGISYYYYTVQLV